MKWIAALTCILCLMLRPIVPAAAAEGAGATGGLADMNSRLAAELAEAFGARDEADRPSQFILTLRGGLLYHAVHARIDPSGRTREDVTLAAVRFADGWRRGSIGTPNDGFALRLNATDLDLDGLQWDGQRLTGSVHARLSRINPYRDYAEGENMHSMLKAARRPVINWTLGGRRRLMPSPQRFDVDARLAAASRLLELRLEGFAGDARPARPPADDDRTPLSHDEGRALQPSRRQALHTTLEHVDGRFLEGEGLAPTYNRALHAIDAGQLTLEDDRLHGTLVVTLLPDPWVRPTGEEGRPGRTVRCEIDARVADGIVQGRYVAQAGENQHEGELSGRVFQTLRGTYVSEGIDGRFSGDLVARVQAMPAGPGDLAVLSPPPLAIPPGVELDPAVRDAIAAYREAHAAMLALDHLPLTASERFGRALDVPAPQFDSPQARDAWMDALARFAQAAATEGSPPRRGVVHPDDEDFGPYMDSDDLRGAELPETIGQDGPQEWNLLTQWQAVGPLEWAGRAQWHPSRLPAVVPVEGVSYVVSRPRLGETSAVRRVWEPAGVEIGETAPAPEPYAETFPRPGRYGAYGRYPASELYYAHQNSSRSHRWYAVTHLDSPRDAELYVAIRVRDLGRLWVNGRLVWDSGPGHEPSAVSVLPVPLREGTNELLVEATQQSINYFPPSPWDRSRFSLWVCTRGRPRTPAQLRDAQETEAAHQAATPFGAAGYFAPGGRHYPEATAPLSWDLSTGTHVAWRRHLGGGGAPPAVADGKLLCPVEPDELVSIDISDGRELWRRSVRAEGADGPSQPTSARASSAAPVVQGDRVWVVFGSGMAACFSLDGQEHWRRQTGLTWTGGVEHSPILVDGRLVLLGTVPGPDRQPRHVLAALDAESGEPLWRSEPVTGPPGLAVVRLGRDGRRKYCFVTPDGTVLDGDDGTILHRSLFHLAGPIVPLTQENIAYFTARNLGQAAIRFWLDDAGRVGARKLWEVRRGGWSSPQQTQPGLLHDGLIYIPRSSDENAGHHPVGWDQLDVYEPRHGQHLARPNPVIHTANSPLPLVRAGEMLVVADSGQRGAATVPRAGIAFVEPGEEAHLLLEQTLREGRLRCAPVFAGQRMFLRVDDSLVCIAGETAAARSDARRELARSVFAQIGPRPIDRLAEIRPPDELDLASDAPIEPLVPMLPPRRWLTTGAFPNPGPGPAGISDIDTFVARPGSEIVAGDRTLRFEPLPADQRIRQSMTMVFRPDGTFYSPAYSLDLGKAIGSAVNSTIYYFVILECSDDIAVRLQAGRGEAWISGQRLADGQAAQLRAGLHPVLLRVDIARVPPFGATILTPRFQQVLSEEQAHQQWRNAVRVRRGVLERIAAWDDPGTSGRAQRYLDEIDPHAPPMLDAGRSGEVPTP